MLTIRLDSMRFYAFHGVMPWEKKAGNRFEVNVALDINDEGIQWSKASIKDTLDYGKPAEIVRKHMAVSKDLLEEVAGLIVEEMLNIDTRIQRVRLEIRKMQPPLKMQIEASVIILERSR
jgi:dihydroneopterin aldolase